MKKPTLTIGIPALNEEQNIGLLLADLLRQEHKTFTLSRIIVISDGSTDSTVAIAKKEKNRFVQVIAGKRRRGLAARQNQLLSNNTSDIFVLLDADIRITDKLFLEKLIYPIRAKKADLTSANLVEVPARNFFEDILLTSMHIKKTIFEKFKHGNNIYNCHGTARAFSQRLAEKLYFPTSVGEDGYSYLFCKANHMKFVYTPKAFVYYTLPSTFSDHKKQSTRFLASIANFERRFNKEFVRSEYTIPFLLILGTLIAYLTHRPLHILAYLVIFTIIKCITFFSNNVAELFEAAVTSKSAKTLSQ